MLSLKGLAEDVRRLEPGETHARVLQGDRYDGDAFAESSRRLNAMVSRLRESIGHKLRVSHMDGVADGRVTRCFIVERL